MNPARAEAAIRKLKSLEGTASRALLNLSRYNKGGIIRVPGISDRTNSEVAQLKRTVSEANRQVPQTPSLNKLLGMMQFKIPETIISLAEKTT